MTLLSAQAYWQHHNTRWNELWRGEVRTLQPFGGVHGHVTASVGLLLFQHARARGHIASLRCGFLLARDPDTLLGPDAAYLALPSASTLIPEAFWPLAPHVAVEVEDVQDREGTLLERAEVYLAAGTEQVWTVYPRQKQVRIHTADHTARTLQAHELLEGFGVLEGFRCPVMAFFELRI